MKKVLGWLVLIVFALILLNYGAVNAATYEYEHDDERHYEIFQGKVSSEGYHYADCDNPTTCRKCGANNVTIRLIFHDYDGEHYEYDEMTHWNTCLKCGDKLLKQKHYASCNKPTVCIECGAENVTIASVVHYPDYDDIDDFYDFIDYDHPQYDETNHWYVCTRCREKTKIGVHYANCDNPTLCSYCGAENVTMSDIIHEYDSKKIQYNDTHHWYFCLKCGEKTISEHHAYCYNPTSCSGCGAKSVTMAEIMHFYNREDPRYDDTNHWYICTRCSEDVEKEKHTFDANVCTKCGYKKDALTKGDSNNDGIVDGRDLLRLARYMAGDGMSVDMAAADVNGDGNVDGRDVLRLAKQLAGG